MKKTGNAQKKAALIAERVAVFRAAAARSTLTAYAERGNAIAAEILAKTGAAS